MQNKLGIELKLGTEYHVATDMIDAFHGGLCHTLADTQYILTEYSHSSEYSVCIQDDARSYICRIYTGDSTRREI